jgi:LDH2 family malate/lactate/ureidoglycolate dehydrogenase
LALNPAAFRPLEDFYADMDELVETLHATKPADPARPVLMPGDPERLSRAERLAGGIPLPRSLLDRLQTIALSAGAPFLLKADHVMAD